MKKLFTILSAVLLTATLWAQSPEKMSYQAVVRDASDNLITSTEVGMQIRILQGSATGTAVYVETQSPTTNANGLVTIEIGTGTVVSGDFATIDWANDTYFIKTETDPAGGTNYTITGVSQLLSVPYALHSKTAESIAGGINETDPVYTGSQAANITATDITNLSNLSGTNTGDQDLGGISTNKQAIKDTASQIRADIPNVSGFVSSEIDPVYILSVASSISTSDTLLWNNCSQKKYVDSLLRINEIKNIKVALSQNVNYNILVELYSILNLLEAGASVSDLVSAGASVIELINAGVELHGIAGISKNQEDNNFTWVGIGNQIWMSENLNVTSEVDGTPLPKVEDDYDWDALTTGAYCFYNNNVDSALVYGNLYNWYAVETNDICPSGWHIPSHDEWTVLEQYLAENGYNYDNSIWDGYSDDFRQKIAKSLASKERWNFYANPNDGAVGHNPQDNNSSNFKGLPGGYQGTGAYIAQSHSSSGQMGAWWSNTTLNDDENSAYCRLLVFDVSNTYIIDFNDNKGVGYSVRCLKD